MLFVFAKRKYEFTSRLEQITGYKKTKIIEYNPSNTETNTPSIKYWRHWFYNRIVKQSRLAEVHR